MRLAVLADDSRYLLQMVLAKLTYSRVRILILLSLIALAVSLRWLGLGSLQEPIFDEIHYQKSAAIQLGIEAHPGMGAWSSHPLISKSPAPNFEHPLLGKYLIGLGMLFAPQDFAASRWASALFGSLSLWLFYLVLRRLSYSLELAFLCCLLFALEPMHILHSRLAMLDIFLVFALLWVLCAFLYHLAYPEKKRWLVVAALGLAFGFSIKWVFAVVAMSFACLFLLLSPSPWRRRWQQLASVVTLALVCYQVWYFIYAAHGMSYGEWLSYHLAANLAATTQIGSHPYAATALGLLTNKPAIWYYFQSTDRGIIGLVCLMNPLLMLLLIPSFAGLIWYHGHRKSWQDAFLLLWLLGIYSPFFLLLSRRPGFLYYLLILTPLIYLCILRAAYLLSLRLPRKLAFGFVTGLILLILCLDLFFLPTVLGLPISSSFFALLSAWTGV